MWSAVNPCRHIPTPLYISEVSCREFWQQFLRNRSRFGPDLVQIWSRFGPDLVQILRSRPFGPILATTQYILDKVPHEKYIYCFGVTISLFLSHNKLYLNDLIDCFNINSCIFLFSTISKKVCLFSLYMFVSTKTYQIVFIVSE
jgi:hypothetical protein